MIFRLPEIPKSEREKLRKLDRLMSEQAKKELAILNQFIFKGKTNEQNHRRFFEK